MHLLSILAAIYVVAGVGIELYRAFTGKKVRWQNLVVVAALVMFIVLNESGASLPVVLAPAVLLLIPLIFGRRKRDG